MVKRKKKEDYGFLWILLPLLILGVLAYGFFNGWFPTISNTIVYQFENPIEKLATIAEDSNLQCYQKAAQLSALYYINPVSTAKECLDFAILDCQDTGKVIDGYGVSGDCCYFTCLVPAPEATCIDSDGGQDDEYYIRGTVTSSLMEMPYTDECDWGTGQLKEYYCNQDKTIGFTMHTCTDYWDCFEGKCSQQLCEDIMNPTPDKCASGYTTDGGVCSYWDLNGGMCISSFELN